MPRQTSPGGCLSLFLISNAHNLLAKPPVHVSYEVRPLGLPADEGLCFLTQITGEFDGGGEGVRVFRRDGQWQVRAKAACEQNQGVCESKPVKVAAACYGFDQKRP